MDSAAWDQQRFAEVDRESTGKSCIVRHNCEELLLADLTVLVKVEFVNHCFPVEGINTLSSQHVGGIRTAHRLLACLRSLSRRVVGSVD